MSLETIYYRTIAPERPWYLFPLYFLLRVLSLFYGLGIWLRGTGYRWGLFPVRELPCRVISVGNLTLGGTGKTPMVIWIAKTLREQGMKPAILSRGYGGSADAEVNVVCDARASCLRPMRQGTNR